MVDLIIKMVKHCSLIVKLTALGGIGGAPNASITIASAGISSATGHYIQVTGITTGTDSYHRISSINSTKQITVALNLLLIHY